MFSGLDRYGRYGPLLLRLRIGVTMLLSGYGKVIGLAGVTLHSQVLRSSGSGTGLTPSFSAPCGLKLQLITQTSCQTSNKVTL